MKRTISIRGAAVAGIALAALLSPLAPRVAAQTPPVAEIVRRLEATRTYDTSRAQVTMTIDDRFGRRTSRMISQSRGADDALIEFTSADERGQKVLRTDNAIYLFYPDAAELVRLQGAALRESMLGSDVSYEDLTGGRSLSETYRAELDGVETIDGHRTYRITLEARRRNVAYPRQTVWVDAELFVARRAEQFALSGRQLKTIVASDIQTVDGYPVPMRTVISDELRRNSSTTVVINDMQIGVPLDDDAFSLDALSW